MGTLLAFRNFWGAEKSNINSKTFRTLFILLRHFIVSFYRQHSNTQIAQNAVATRRPMELRSRLPDVKIMSAYEVPF